MIDKSQDRLLQLIKPRDLRAYLLDRGWTEVSSKRDYMLKYKSPKPISSDGKYISLFVPKHENFVDYNETIDYALRVISAFETRTYENLLNQILYFADCLKTRIIEAKRGMIPLDQGISLYKGMLELITYSACAEYEPHIKRFPRKLDRAINYAETSLMGQSEVGSYIANIYIPLERKKSAFAWDTTSPFARKVVLRILRGLDDLYDSVKEDNSDPIIDNYRKGLNSNMCDALINIIEVGMGNNIIVSAVLEPAYPLPDNISTEFILTPQSKNYLQDARSKLREDAPQEEERSFIGYVRLLTRPEEVEKGTIILRTIDVERNKTINIKMDLNDFDYKLAVEAHTARRYVFVKGILERKGKWWILENPHKLGILEEDSELPWRSLTNF
ncbi:MAG: hypothetical protein A4E49_03177 [Methanosaeta sp. PtaU1.Bin112]|nr:MAG: hypothetical protein A4E49_03177 [Methanosaeta sp. PtaU1.Bin112]